MAAKKTRQQEAEHHRACAADLEGVREFSSAMTPPPESGVVAGRIEHLASGHRLGQRTTLGRDALAE
jgi:hypothetical protein